MRLLAWGIPQMSRERCVRLANALGTFGFHFDRRGRAVALANIECAFGDALTPEQRLAAVKESYINFIRVMFDLFWAPALAKPENRHWLRLKNWREIIDDARRAKRGIIFLTLHAGHWEWANLSCGFAGMQALSVAENFRNPELAPIVTALREVSGMKIIPQENAMLRMLREVKRGGGAGFLADLSVHPKQAATIVRAFGLEMSASILHGVMAQRAHAIVACAKVLPRPDGSCDSSLEVLDIPEGASIQQIAQLCWDYYEPMLRENPGLWMWPYKHFRYKPRDATRSYPFYSNESGAFEKLRRNSP